MYGMDISSYQRAIDLSKGNYDFCIIKATEGLGSKSPTFYDYSVQLTKLNKLIGCYHYARPDKRTTVKGMEMEADYFLSVVSGAGLLYKAILILDWEQEPFDREDLVSAWIEYVKKNTGVTPFIYGSKSKLSKWKNWNTFKNSPIWLAQYPTVKPFPIGKYPTDVYSNIKPPDTIDWLIWQYTSNGYYPNFNGNVDLDYSVLTKDQWLEYAGAVQKDTDGSLSVDMKWSIAEGLIIGDENGNYNPDGYLTKEQAAAMFRRFYMRFIEK